ncbi:MAG TPA: DUF4397 domain-containing protein [Gemmatimonadaceae bacterium]|nr:DUF4397 domain-containing protein [Gemmatimonadaceae bacterium]
MKTRVLTIAALIPMLAVAACDTVEMNGPGTGGTNNTATVRFVNATGTGLDLAQNGSVGTGMGNIVYGGSTSCFTVNSSSPNLSVRNAGGTTTISGLTTNFQPGGTYTVLAYPSASGATQFAVLPNTFTPTSGQAGLRVFNATGSGSYDIYTAASGGSFVTPSATAVNSGTASSFFNVAPGTGAQLRISNAGTTTSALTLNNLTWTPGQTQTLIIAPPATGSTTPRTFLVSGC